MSREKRRIVITAVVALLIVLVLSVVLSMQLWSESTGGVEAKSLFGLLNVTANNAPVAITAKNREEEYQSRLPLTNDIVGNFESRVLRFLSSGNFAELDDWLLRLETTYQEAGEESGQDLSYMSLIQNIRSDIAIIQSFSRLSDKSGAAILLTKFQMPEVLAAAIIYTPLSIKLDSIINQDSLILPAVYAQDAHLTCLKRIELRPEEYIPRIEDINRHRTLGNEVIGLVLFEFQAYGDKYRLEIVAQKDYTYAPYRMFRVEDVAEPDEPVTVSYLKRFRTEYAKSDWFDLDSFYVALPHTDSEGS